MPFVTNSLAQNEFDDDLHGLTEAEREWLENDEPHPTEKVNEGEFIWLELAANQTEYHLTTQIQMTKSSLQTGWLPFIQCHNHIDPISKVEIVYQPFSIKALSIESYSNINQVSIEDNRVLMEGVKPGGEICVSGASQTLKAIQNNWQIRRGPYMRRFLDGYYPMQVTEIIDWSETDLVFIDSSPQALSGFQQILSEKSLKTTYRFEGTLNSEYRFKQP